MIEVTNEWITKHTCIQSSGTRRHSRSLQPHKNVERCSYPCKEGTNIPLIKYHSLDEKIKWTLYLIAAEGSASLSSLDYRPRFHSNCYQEFKTKD